MNYFAEGLLCIAALGIVWEIVQEVRHSAPKTSALADKKRKLPLILLFGLLVWLMLTALLAQSGFLADTAARPPRLLLLIGVASAAVLWIGLGRGVAPLLRVVRPERIVEAQTFRILVEVAFLILFYQNRVPVMMTPLSPGGRNWDILIGLSAPLLATLVFRKKRLSPNVALAWNVVGIVLVLNVALHGLLSAPGPLQILKTTPPFDIIVRFPFVWIATFFVPLALLLHILSIRQCWNLRKQRL